MCHLVEYLPQLEIAEDEAGFRGEVGTGTANAHSDHTPTTEKCKAGRNSP